MEKKTQAFSNELISESKSGASFPRVMPKIFSSPPRVETVTGGGGSLS